jgi:septal ring factor EnvC (AmiA/AmiB activator)
MEERMFALESVVEKNTKMVERLDRSMDHLTQSMADLRLQMSKGFADLRQEMAQGKADLRKEMAQGQIELLREMAANYEKLQNKISAVPEKAHRGTTTGFVNPQNHFDPIFFCLLALNFIIAFVILGLVTKDFIGLYLK